MPPPAKKPHYFLARQKTIEAFNRFLNQPDGPRLGDLRASYGVGKTTVAANLYRRLNTARSWAWVDLSDMRSELAGSHAIQTLEQLSQALRICRRCLAGMGRDLFAPEEFEKFDRAMEKILSQVENRQAFPALLKALGIVLSPLEFNLGPAKIAPSKPFETMATQALSGSGEPQGVFLKISDLMLKDFAGRVEPLAANRHVLIFLDNYCLVRDTFLGEWLIHHLLPRLKHCKVVLIHTGSSLENDIQDEQVAVLPLEWFDEQETRFYIKQRLGEAAVQAGWLEHVQKYCKGHPYLTEMYVDLIEQQGNALPAASDLIHKLDPRQNQDTWERFDSLVYLWGQDFHRRSSADAARLMDTACLLNDFDLALLEKVSSLSHQNFQDAWHLLNQETFLERYGRSTYHVHDLFGRIRVEWLMRTDLDFANKIHELAAQHYREWLQKEEEECTSGIWARMHNYEKDNWQYMARRWLFHLSKASSSGLEIATGYFDAFYWWGEYLPFPFCDMLLKELQQFNLPENSARVLDLLVSFHKEYIPARRREKGVILSPHLLVTLEKLMGRINLDNISELDGPRWHLRGVLQNYIGEVLSEADPHAPAAELVYQDSIHCFTQAEAAYDLEQRQINDPYNKRSRFLSSEKSSESWFRTWQNIWLAGLYIRRGDAEQALGYSQAAEKLIRQIDQRDIEVLARVYCTYGDAFLLQGHLELAVQSYCWYALYAFGFLLDEYGEGGDLYTLGFYQEMIEHIGEKLETLQDDPARLRLAWQQLHTFWLSGASELLPAGCQEPPSVLTEAISLDEFGHVIDHHLPLPSIPPVQVNEQQLSINIEESLHKQIETAYHLLARTRVRPAPPQTGKKKENA